MYPRGEFGRSLLGDGFEGGGDRGGDAELLGLS